MSRRRTDGRNNSWSLVFSSRLISSRRRGCEERMARGTKGGRRVAEDSSQRGEGEMQRPPRAVALGPLWCMHTYTNTQTHTHVHFNVGFLRVHVSVVARVTLRVSRVVTVRDAVHQMPVQLVRIPEDFRRDDRSVTPESLQAQPAKGKFYALPRRARIYRI